MTFTTKSLEELSEEQISNLLVLMKSKGRNSYKYLSQENVRPLRSRAGADRRSSAATPAVCLTIMRIPSR